MYGSTAVISLYNEFPEEHLESRFDLSIRREFKLFLIEYQIIIIGTYNLGIRYVRISLFTFTV